MKTKKLLSSLLVVAFAFSFLLTGCDKKMDDSATGDDAAMMEDGDKMDGGAMDSEDGDAMEAMEDDSAADAS